MEKGMKVEILEPSLEHNRIPIKKWRKDNSFIYVLANKEWFELVEGTVLQLWSSRDLELSFLRLQDMKKDSDLESLKMAVQKCRENREHLMRQQAPQRGFLEQESQKRIGVGYDEKKERIVRFHIRKIVALEWEKLEMEKKRRMEQIGVGHEEEEPRKSETSPRFQDSNNSKIGVPRFWTEEEEMGVRVLQIPAK